jgi:hypothetical protein
MKNAGSAHPAIEDQPFTKSLNPNKNLFRQASKLQPTAKGVKNNQGRLIDNF